MRQLRFGSYSIGGDLGGHAVLVPLEVDDAVLLLVAAAAVAGGLAAVGVATAGASCLGASSDFSGVSLVISEKSETVWNRRPGLVGLRLRRAMARLALEEVDRVALGEGDDRPLGVGALAEGERCGGCACACPCG